jgi:RHS repeat-associated protein
LKDRRGNNVLIAYDQADQATRLMNQRGYATYFAYDGVGNLTLSTRGPGITAGYGQATYGTSPYGGRVASEESTTYFYYGGLARLNVLRDALGNSTYYFYDLEGQLTKTRNPLGHPTYFGYDKLNRFCRTQDASGAVAYFDYDNTGNPVRLLDPNGHAQLIRYDALDRPDAIQFAGSSSMYFFYDEVGNRVKEQDSRTCTTYYSYDGLNRITKVQDALARTLYFEYDSVSNFTKFVDAENAAASYTYDEVNRPVLITYSPGGAVSLDGLRSDSSFTYDAAGNVTQMVDLWGTHRMSYDATHRLLRHNYPNGSAIYFEYDAWNNLAARVCSVNAGKAYNVCDLIDRRIRVQSPSGTTTYFKYDAASNLTQRLLGNGVKTDIAYDPVERISSWRISDKNSTPLTYFDYVRDAKGLVSKAVREANYTIYYSYDENDWLTRELWARTGPAPTEVYGFRYTYDLSGNRLKASINGSDTYYFYDAANQLTVRGTTALFANPSYYFYDRNGSLTNLVEPVGASYFAYNVAGLIAKIKWRDTSATYFFYDGYLNRYAMTASGVTTYFMWDGPDLLHEINVDGTIKEEHTNARVAIAGVGQLLETNRPGQPQAKIYPVMDPRGSITKWIQTDGSTVYAAMEYDAFGQIIPGSNVGTWPGRFTYQGQSWIEIVSGDGSQRLLLSATRIYDPVTGRFLQNEPLLDTRTLFHYLYVDQNPVSLVDPLGLQGKVVVSDPNHPLARAATQNVATTGQMVASGQIGTPLAQVNSIPTSNIDDAPWNPQVLKALNSHLHDIAALSDLDPLDSDIGTHLQLLNAILDGDLQKYNQILYENTLVHCGNLLKGIVDTGGGLASGDILNKFGPYLDRAMDNLYRLTRGKPTALGRAASIQDALADAKQRLAAAFPPRAVNARTIAVGRTSGGELVFSANQGDAKTTGIVRSLGEDYNGIATLLPWGGKSISGPLRLGHAESLMIWTTPSLRTVGATRPICLDSCQKQLRWFGIQPLSPLGADKLPSDRFVMPGLRVKDE